MRKKIILLAAALMMFMGVVSASSINGDYKGNPIVKVMSNGNQLQSDEVPAMIYDGHTMVPISLLRQIGASVEWNQDTYSVDVKLPEATTNVNNDRQKLIDEIDMFRFLYFANEQAALSSQLMPLIDTISNYPSDSQRMIDNINRLQVETISDWIKHLSSKQSYGNDIAKINQIDKSLLIIKNYLLKFDTASANAEWNTLKTNINDLYSKYDSSLINSINGTVTPPADQPPIQQPIQNIQQPIQQQPESNSGIYTINDAVIELGFTSSANITVEARSIAIELVEIRKTKKQSDYSIQDALVDLGIPQGSRPTLATLRQAIKLISLH